MVALVAIVVAAAVLGGGVGAEERWQPRMAGGGNLARLRSRRLVQGEGITRAIQEVRQGLEEDTEVLIVPEWFEGFGDKETVVEKKPTKEPVKDWLGGSGGWTRKQPGTGSKGRKDAKKSQGSGRLNLLTRNKEVKKDSVGLGDNDETRGQMMSIVKRRRRPGKREEALRGAEKVAPHDLWSPRANGETTMAPSTYQDYKTSVAQQTSKKLGPTTSDGGTEQSVHDHPTTGGGGFQDFFPPHTPQDFFGLEARGGQQAKRCRSDPQISQLNQNQPPVQAHIHQKLEHLFLRLHINFCVAGTSKKCALGPAQRTFSVSAIHSNYPRPMLQRMNSMKKCWQEIHWGKTLFQKP